MQPYMLLLDFFDLSHNMLHYIRLKSTLANGGKPLVDTLHKVQDELPVGGTHNCSKVVFHSASMAVLVWEGDHPHCM